MCSIFRKALQDLVQRAAVAEVGKRNGLQRIVSQSHTPTLSSHHTRFAAAAVKDRGKILTRLACLLASFFLPSASLINMYIHDTVHIYVSEKEKRQGKVMQTSKTE